MDEPKRIKLSSCKFLNSASTSLLYNDDEDERNQRRQSSKPSTALVSPKRSPSHKRNSAPFLSPIQPKLKETLTETQLSELYTQTIRLAAAGKITQKNTWSIRLIDYIDDVLSREKTEADAKVTKSSSLFRKASNTLDASIKIYSSRVDSVHSQMFKVLGGLSSSHAEVEEKTPDESMEREPKRMKVVETLLEGEKAEALCLTEADLGYEVDPMFFKMASVIDKGGARGLMLNRLAVTSDLRIVFDSDCPISGKIDLENGKNDENEEFLNTESFTKLLQETETEEKKQLCPLINAFRKESSIMKKQIATLRGGGDVSDDETWTEISQPFQPKSSHQNDNDFNDQNDDEFNDQNDNEFNLINDDDDENFEMTTQNSNGSNAITIEDVSFSMGTQNNSAILQPETSLLGDDFLNWAGPNFWRRRKTNSAAERTAKQSGDSSAHKGPKTDDDLFGPKPPRLIDFERLLELELPVEKGGRERRPRKARRTVSKKGGETAHTLPVDMHLKADLFLRPFYRAHLMASFVHRKAKKSEMGRAEENGEEELNVQWYDYDNPNDRRYCVPLMKDESEEVAPFESMGEGETERELSQWDGGENDELKPLMEWTSVTAQVDVRRLKKGLWEALERGGGEEGEKDVSFVEAVKTVRKSHRKMGGVSMQYCFVCLLHLANENGLNMKSGTALGDFGVEKIK